MLPLYLLYFILQAAGQMMAAASADNSSFRLVFLILMYLSMAGRGVIWIYILKKTALSRAHAVTSLTYLTVPLLAVVFLGETFKPLQITAAFMIITGLFIFSLGDRGNTL